MWTRRGTPSFRVGLGLERITHFDATDWPVQIAGEVKDFDWATRVGPKAPRRMDLFSIYAVAAAQEAVKTRDLPQERELGDRAGVYVGSGIGGIREIAEKALIFDEKGARGLGPFFIPKSLTNLAGGHVAIAHRARGPSLCISTACATGNHSIGEAWRGHSFRRRGFGDCGWGRSGCRWSGPGRIHENACLVQTKR